jgi:hypothetical protein
MGFVALFAVMVEVYATFGLFAAVSHSFQKPTVPDPNAHEPQAFAKTAIEARRPASFASQAFKKKPRYWRIVPGLPPQLRVRTEEVLKQNITCSSWGPSITSQCTGSWSVDARHEKPRHGGVPGP